MKKIIVTIAATCLLFISCCPRSLQPPSKIVEKVIVGSKYGHPHYFFLLENGREVETTSKSYVQYKVGDSVSYTLTNCEE